MCVDLGFIFLGGFWVHLGAFFPPVPIKAPARGRIFKVKWERVERTEDGDWT